MSEEPQVWPVDFEEWRVSKPPMMRVLLAGFRSHLRRHGGLLRKQTTADWEEQFKSFREKGPAGRRSARPAL